MNENSASILDNLRTRRGLETAQWLNTLTNEISSGQHQAVSPAPQPVPGVSPSITRLALDPKVIELIRWMDQIFNNFEAYASRFNASAQGTDLIVTCSRPQIEEQSSKESYLYDDPSESRPDEEKTYDGHLVTRFWAMLLRGTVDKVQVFILPAEAMLGFSLHKIDESVHKPLLTMESDWDNDHLKWHIAETRIHATHIPMLTKELFGDLIRVASGQMTESELFAHPLQEMNLGENLAVGFKPSPQLSQDAQVVQPPQPASAAVAPATGQGNFTLTSPKLAQQLIAYVDADVSELFKIGQNALSSDNKQLFHTIKSITEKLETMKDNIHKTLSELSQLIDETKRSSQ